MAEKSSIYANNAVIGLGQFEATIVFQRMSLKSGAIVAGGPQNAVVAEEVDVIMALSHLKIFAASVLESVHAYESERCVRDVVYVDGSVCKADRSGAAAKCCFHRRGVSSATRLAG